MNAINASRITRKKKKPALRVDARNIPHFGFTMMERMEQKKKEDKLIRDIRIAIAICVVTALISLAGLL